jgi:hypothetical protein
MMLGDSPFDISSVAFNAMQTNAQSQSSPTNPLESSPKQGFWERLSGAWSGLNTIAPEVSDAELEFSELLV